MHLVLPLHAEPTSYYDDEIQKQLKTEQEQKDDMTQDIDIRQQVESKALVYIRFLPTLIQYILMLFLIVFLLIFRD